VRFWRAAAWIVRASSAIARREIRSLYPCEVRLA
jgi:hypothetical protein